MPVDKGNYLAKEANIARDNLGKVKVDIAGPFTIDWAHYSDTDVNAAISYLTAAGLTGEFTRRTADQANLKLVKFSIDGEGPLKTLLNDYAGAARSYLKDEGNDGRVTSSIWVVMDATLASAVKSCGKVTGKATVDGFRVTVDTKTCTASKSTVDIPPGTTFAYGLHKVKKWNNGKTKVEDMEDDQSGTN